MTYPTKYTRQFDFQSYQNANPNRPLPGDKVNADLNAAQISVGEIVEFLKTSLRSDGAVMNQSIGYDQLSYALQSAGLGTLTAWAASTAYEVSRIVVIGGSLYVCEVAHTSGGDFAGDLADGKWSLIVELPEGPQGPSVEVSIGATTTLAPGASATVTNSGTDTAPVFEFGIPAGVQGAQGIQGIPGIPGTNGAVAVSGTPTVNQFTAWVDSTTVKGVSITGIVKGNGASAPAAAVAGTDYYAPSGTDVAIADGGTGQSTAAAGFDALKQSATATYTGVVELATDAETQTGTDTVRAITPANLTAAAMKQGKQTIFIPAAAMISRTTNGPSAGTVESTTNKVMSKTLDFDTTTQEFAQFSVWFPKSWNLGTVTFQPVFSQLTTAAGGVVFGMAGVALSDADDIDAAFGTAQTSTKTAGTLGKYYIGPESAAITIAGTPAAGDVIVFQINRTVADASDTLAQDARLHGIRLFFTTNAATDA